ncbi:MAG: hypothetical protein M1837_006429 [Sclerophora amabilis]|nr:MAG: hypothetical protein M1837_006429 [Sclerophora amabilis]
MLLSSSSSFFLLPLLAATAQAAQSNVPSTLGNILANTHQSPLYSYPTDLTRGIVPVKIHSHNDYWRDVPFYSGSLLPPRLPFPILPPWIRTTGEVQRADSGELALSVGAISVEADVWLYNETLYVGHERSALTAERTLEALYIEPILDTLRRLNPQTPFVTSPTKNGVFDTDNEQTLYLWIDIKTDSATTFPQVVKALEPLRQANYLTTLNTTADPSSSTPVPVPGPITVIGTGNTALSDILSLVPTRDIFYDAPLPLLSLASSSSSSRDTKDQNITSSTSPIASTNFATQFGRVTNTTLNATQLTKLREQIHSAHDLGIGVRYWDTPAWPVSTRNGLWRQLCDEGVDLLNVDDLLAGSGLGEEVW